MHTATYNTCQFTFMQLDEKQHTFTIRILAHKNHITSLVYGCQKVTATSVQLLPFTEHY
jgi:hypothetical protein